MSAHLKSQAGVNLAFYFTAKFSVSWQNRLIFSFNLIFIWIPIKRADRRSHLQWLLGLPFVCGFRRFPKPTKKNRRWTKTHYPLSVSHRPGKKIPNRSRAQLHNTSTWSLLGLSEMGSTFPKKAVHDLILSVQGVFLPKMIALCICRDAMDLQITGPVSETDRISLNRVDFVWFDWDEWELPNLGNST